jgi:hypothetical protein
MFKRLPGVVLLALVASVAAAQQPTQVPKPAAPASAAKSEAEPAPAPRPAEPAGQPLNVKLDVTITDQVGPGQPAKKTVSLVVADRASGSIRSWGNTVRASLNVDATPTVLSNGTVRLSLGLEYNPRQEPSAPAAAEKVTEPARDGGTSLNERIAVLLDPGKPMVISQAADPMSDRRITVEVRATVMK